MTSENMPCPRAGDKRQITVQVEPTSRALHAYQLALAINLST